MAKMRIPSKPATVFVGMSGGVDSSVAAYLLKKQGHEVVGVFMRCYNIDGCAERDAEDARRVAGKLEIPFYVWDFEEEYKRRVVDYMVEGYKRGITPNPDVMCNREVKFGLFFEKALAMGADFVATGHYVRLARGLSRKQHDFLPAIKSASLSSRHSSLRSEAELARLRDVSRKASREPSLWIAKDNNKDQSYFLWTLTPKQLARCLFPIGDYLKSEVRAIAKKAGIPTAEKKDSQGICFLGEVTIADFLGNYLPEKRGAVLTVGGEKVGEHRGAHFYTIGQREGIFVGGARRQKRGENARPLYVTSKDVKTNTLTVAEREDPALTRKEVELTDVNWTSSSGERRAASSADLRVLARVRYRQPLVSARLVLEARSSKLVFDSPVQFVAEGQSAVWYSKKGEMLGGGVITRSR